MERFVRSPIRMAGHFGTATTLIILVAVLGFGAPPWIFLPVSIAGLTLFLQLSERAEELRERERGRG